MQAVSPLAPPAPPAAPPWRHSAHTARTSGPPHSEDLLHATARLSLHTARRVRLLSAVVLRTLLIPDNSSAGPSIKNIATQEKQYSDLEACYTWAQLLLAVLALPASTLPVESTRLLAEHAASNTRPDQMQLHLAECSVTRTYSGDASIVRMAGDATLQGALQALSRCLIASGAQLRLGPAPRSTEERAVTAALTATRRA